MTRRAIATLALVIMSLADQTFMAGRACEQAGDIACAARLYSQAAKEGSTDARFNLGVLARQYPLSFRAPTPQK